MFGSSQRSKRRVTNEKTQRSNICGYGLDSVARTSDNGCGSGVDLRLVPSATETKQTSHFIW